MKKKRRKILLVCIVGLCMVSLAVFALAVSPLDIFKQYEGVEEDEFSAKLSKYSFSELCDEINAMSKEGVDLSELQFHSVALAEKAKKVSAKDLQKLIADESNSENLRVICVQLLDFLAKEDDKYALKDTSMLEKLILNEKVSSSIRQNTVWALRSGAAANEILEKLIFQSDEALAFQAMKRLSSDAPERAMAAAETLIRTEELNEKHRAAIMIISEQLAKSEDTKEKDEWIAYCMEVYQKSSASKADLMRDTIIFGLSDMFYSKALYAIINSEQIDESSKPFCIEQNYQVLVNVLGIKHIMHWRL